MFALRVGWSAKCSVKLLLGFWPAAGVSGEVKDIGLKELEQRLCESSVEKRMLMSLRRWSFWLLVGGPNRVLHLWILRRSQSVPPVTEDLEEAQTFKYFVCNSKNGRYRRLHRWHGCGFLKPGLEITKFEGFDDLNNVEFDAACKHCWRDSAVVDNGSSSAESTDESDGSCFMT